jgi:hypothetical protein
MFVQFLLEKTLPACHFWKNLTRRFCVALWFQMWVMSQHHIDPAERKITDASLSIQRE